MSGTKTRTNTMKSRAPKSKKMLDNIKDAIPPWITANIRSTKSWKLLLRCWIASWAAFVIVLPDRSLTALGNASFFVLLPSLMMPPSFPVQLFFFLISTIIVGMLLGWSVGCAAMRAALAARNQELLQQTLLIAQKSAAGAANPDAQFELSIFMGTFLDVRSTAVYGCFLGVGVFFFALLRAYVPRLALMSVFGSIMIDVFCSYGPLFPIPEYTIISSLLISAGTYCAIGLTVCVLVFPETMLHKHLESVVAHLSDIEAYFKDFDGVVSSFGRVGDADNLNGVDRAEDIEKGDSEEVSDAERKETIEKSGALRSKILAAQQNLSARSSFLSAEFTWGRWNGHDARGIEEPLLMLVVRVAGFHSFAVNAQRCLEQTRGVSKPESSPSVSTEKEKLAPSHQHNGSFTADEDSSAEGGSSTDKAIHMEDSAILHPLNRNPEGPPLEEIIPILLSCTSDLKRACLDALIAVREMVDLVNTGRYKYPWSSGQKDEIVRLESNLDNARKRLQEAREEFLESKRLEIISPFEEHIALMERQNRNHVARSLLIASLFQANLTVSASAILSLVDYVVTVTQKRTKSRLWMPLNLNEFIWTILAKRRKSGGTEESGADDADMTLGEEDPVGVDDEEMMRDEQYKRDPDSLPPSNVLQRITYAVHRLYLWLRTPEAIFCIKYVIVTIALWLPSVFKSSAYFAYTEKSIWAIVMAQTTLNIFISDQLYNYFARLIGTFIGLIVGLIIWYIGSGSGTGNPYGLAAVMGVVLIPVIFIRIFAPITLIVPVLMFVATVSLIVGYSWQDDHLFVIGAPGTGWDVAWRRWVLVIIGCAASFIVMLFPPTSGKKAVRLRNASIIREISSIYSFLLSQWVKENGDAESSKALKSGDSLDVRPKWMGAYRKRILGLSTQIQALRQMTTVAKFESGIRGKWRIEEYRNLVETEAQMLGSLAQLSGALTHLDSEWRSSVNSRTRVLNPHFISESLSMFSLVSQSLQTAEPLHQVLPTSLIHRALYHESKVYSQGQQQSEETQLSNKYSMIERVRSVQFMYFATAVSAVSQIINSLDELHRVTKVLCGEVPFEGFDNWKIRYEQAQQLV